MRMLCMHSVAHAVLAAIVATLPPSCKQGPFSKLVCKHINSFYFANSNNYTTVVMYVYLVLGFKFVSCFLYYFFSSLAAPRSAIPAVPELSLSCFILWQVNLTYDKYGWSKEIKRDKLKVRSSRTRRDSVPRPCAPCRPTPPNGGTLISMTCSHCKRCRAENHNLLPFSARHSTATARRRAHISRNLCLSFEFMVQYITIVVQMSLESCKNMPTLKAAAIQF